MFKRITGLLSLIPGTAQTVATISQRTMQTNYGDYVRFLELVGNVKVSEILDDLDKKKPIHGHLREITHVTMTYDSWWRKEGSNFCWLKMFRV